MPLTPIGIYYADTSTNMSIADITAAMATSISDKIGGIEQTQTVNSQAERDLLYPTPIQGNTVFRNDIGSLETYYGLYNISTNPGGRDSAGWYTNSRQDGLVPIRPTLATFITGTGSVNSLGVINFSGCTGVNLDNVFTSNYKNYAVLFTQTSSSAGQSIGYRLRLAGADATTAAYVRAGWRVSADATSTSFSNAGTNVGYIYEASNAASDYYSAVTDIFEPAIARRTKFMTKAGGLAGTNFAQTDSSTIHTVTTAYDGLTILCSAGTFSGTLQIFGYND